jgi:hypothetical protein
MHHLYRIHLQRLNLTIRCERPLGPLRCYRERYQHHLHLVLPQISIVSHIALAFQLGQLQAITLLALQQALYNHVCLNSRPPQRPHDCQHRSQGTSTAQPAMTRNRRSHRYQRYLKRMNLPKNLLQILHFSTVVNQVCRLMQVVSIARQRIVSPAELLFGIRRRTIGNQKPENMALLDQTRMLISKIMPHRSKRRICNRSGCHH